MLGLTLAAVGAATVGGTPAYGAGVVVGDLLFDVPAGLTPTAAVGGGWQWQGALADPADPSRPSMVLLARADLASTDAEEIFGMLLAGSVAGDVPGLSAQPLRTRTMPGGGQQARAEVGYRGATRLALHGTVLVATRSRPPAAVLAVLGDDALTAGDVSTVLDSARWAS